MTDNTIQIGHLEAMAILKMYYYRTESSHTFLWQHLGVEGSKQFISKLHEITSTQVSDFNQVTASTY